MIINRLNYIEDVDNSCKKNEKEFLKILKFDYTRCLISETNFFSKRFHEKLTIN